MKFFHLSDLHFGKQLHGYDLEEEQRQVIHFILEAAKKEKPDAIVVAGDIYDKSVPSGSAMALLEEFFLGIDDLSGVLGGKTPELLVIAGNHDSAPRLRYGSTFLKRYHIHISVFPPMDEGERLQKVTLQDEHGEVNFYLLPYTSPGMLRGLAGSDLIHSADDAVRYLLERETIDWTARNVLVSHQFYCHGTGTPVQCDSETPRLYVGGLDSVDTSAVERFDYVALGHIHSPQSLGAEHIRYCGTPYSYSVSEAGQKKSVTVVELGQKGQATLRDIPFEPQRQVRCLRGTLEEVSSMACARTQDNSCTAGICHDYVSITLTDDDLPDAPRDYLEHYYDHILELKIDNTQSRRMMEEEIAGLQEMTPFEAFDAFFADTMGRELTDGEKKALQEILQEVRIDG